MLKLVHSLVIRLSVFTCFLIGVSSCDESGAIGHIEIKVAKFLRVDNSDLKLVGTDFSRDREPVAVFDVDYSLVPQGIKSLLDDGKAFGDEEFRRANHYLKSAGMSQITSKDNIDGLATKVEISFSFIFILKDRRLTCIYLGGV